MKQVVKIPTERTFCGSHNNVETVSSSKNNNPARRITKHTRIWWRGALACLTVLDIVGDDLQ